MSKCLVFNLPKKWRIMSAGFLMLGHVFVSSVQAEEQEKAPSSDQNQVVESDALKRAAAGEASKETSSAVSAKDSSIAQQLNSESSVLGSENQNTISTVGDKVSSTAVKPALSTEKYYQRDSVDSGSSLVSMVLGLTLILGLIAAVAWAMKRFAGIGPAGGKHIKVVSATAVGNRERIALIEVGDKNILIGITPQNISMLHVFEKDEIPDEAPPSEFARKLQTLISKGNNSQ